MNFVIKSSGDQEGIDCFRELEQCMRTISSQDVVDKVNDLQNVDQVRELLVLADIESKKHKDSEVDGA